MLSILKNLFKRRKHLWVETSSFLSSTAYPGNYYISFTCQNCWRGRTFVLSPQVYGKLKGKSPAEFFEGIESQILAGTRIPFHRYHRSTNAWVPYYMDTRRNPYGQHDMGAEIFLVPGQLTEFRDSENCNQWAKGKPMQPLHK